MPAIEDLTTELAKLPGIGRKTALRLTYHLLKRPADQSRRLAEALMTLADRVRTCDRCFNLTEEPVCAICRDARREDAQVCVVEEAADIGAIERAGEYRGVYHVLGGRLSPLDGVGPDDLHVAPLLARVAAGGIREVIIALGTAAGAVFLAFLALYWRRLPVLRRGFEPGTGLVRPLRRFQSGVVNDYVTWIVIGVACLGGALAFSIR